MRACLPTRSLTTTPFPPGARARLPGSEVRAGDGHYGAWFDLTRRSGRSAGDQSAAAPGSTASNRTPGTTPPRLAVSFTRRFHGLAVAFALFVSFNTGPAFAEWVRFRNETGLRLEAETVLGNRDVEQKAFAAGDVDLDGDVDLVCIRKSPTTDSSGRRGVLFLNEGTEEGHALDGVLVDRTPAFASVGTDGGLGLLDPTNGVDVALVDVDNDGWLDIVTVSTLSDGRPRNFSHPRVYRNQGQSSGQWLGFLYEFDRIPLITSIPEDITGSPRFSSLAVGDVNGDGFDDLYFSSNDSGPNPSPDLNDRLLISNRRGFFSDSRDSRVSLSILASGASPSAVLGDLNGDQLPDLIKCETVGPSPGLFVHVNRTQGITPGFFDVSVALDAGLASEIALGDLNNDGLSDLVVPGDGYDRYLLRRSDISAVTGFRSRILVTDRLFDEGFGGNPVIADLDGDGWNDVIVTDVDFSIQGCARRTRFYKNLGDAPDITLQEQFVGLLNPTGVHDVAVLDVNRDALPDLVVGRCTGSEVWIQEPSPVTTFDYEGRFPAYSPPGDPASVRVRIHSEGNTTPTSVTLHVSTDGMNYDSLAMQAMPGDRFDRVFPPAECGTFYSWYLSASFRNGSRAYDPPEAIESAVRYQTVVSGEPRVLLHDDMENVERVWTVSNENLTAGAWERADPVGTISGIRPAAPEDDASRQANGKAFVTGNGARGLPPNTHDVDGGPTWLTSPPIDLQGTDAVISYAYWVFSDDRFTGEEDLLLVEVSGDGQNWTRAASHRDSESRWARASFRAGGLIALTSGVRVRFGIADAFNNSIAEAGVDEFHVLALPCSDSDQFIMGSEPPDGSIDPRQPSPLSGAPLQGWNTAELLFHQPAGNVSPDELILTQRGGTGIAPSIDRVQTTAANRLAVFFAGPIKPQAWTDILHRPSASGTRLGFLPGDFNADQRSNADDVTALETALRTTNSFPIWRLDIDRSNVFTALDLARLIDVLIGAELLEEWNGRRLP